MKSNSFLLTLAAFLVVALGIMGYMIYNQDPISNKVDVQTVTLNKQSPSDETDAIEKDLNNTDLDSIDKEVGDIDKELNSSF